MAIQTILTCLLDEESASRLCEASSALAARFDAHLIGHHSYEALVVYPGVGMHVPVQTLTALNAAQTAQAEAIAAIFNDVTERVGIRAEWRVVDTGTALASDRMIESARAADLVVMSRPLQGDGRTDQRFAVDQVIRDGGRPVLLIPEEGLGEGVGKTVVIAHAGTRESARAAFDVLPMLEPGASVHIVHVGDTMDELRDGAMTALSAAIARHGHEVTMGHRARHGASVASVLCDAAREVGADLIAAGAYGHSRTYAFFLGATTGELIRESPLPVLFSA